MNRNHKPCISSVGRGIVALLVLAAWRSGADPLVLPPQEAVRLTLDHSPYLKSQDEAIRSAEARRLQAEAGLHPQLEARAQANHFEGLENQALGPVSIPVIDNQFSASIGITQPLYTGGRATQQKLSARLMEESTHRSWSASSADLTLQTLTTYWEWSKAMAQCEAFTAAVQRLEAQTRDTRNLRQSGMATDNDVLAVEVALDQAKLQLDDAERLTEVCRVRLTQLMGRPIAGNEVPQRPLIPVGLTLPSLDQALATALTNRQELGALRLETRATSALVSAARADNRPQLSLVARYEQGNPNPRDFPPDKEWRDDALVGAVVAWNLFDGGLTRGRIAEAQARARQSSLKLQSREESVISEVREAHLALRHALERTQTAQHAERSAQRNLEVATDLWKNGTARHSDVLDAQWKLTSATSQRIAAEADTLLSDAAFKHSVGVLP